MSKEEGKVKTSIDHGANHQDRWDQGSKPEQNRAWKHIIRIKQEQKFTTTERDRDTRKQKKTQKHQKETHLKAPTQTKSHLGYQVVVRAHHPSPHVRESSERSWFSSKWNVIGSIPALLHAKVPVGPAVCPTLTPLPQSLMVPVFSPDQWGGSHQDMHPVQNLCSINSMSLIYSGNPYKQMGQRIFLCEHPCAKTCLESWKKNIFIAITAMNKCKCPAAIDLDQFLMNNPVVVSVLELFSSDSLTERPIRQHFTWVWHRHSLACNLYSPGKHFPIKWVWD